jgi:uncharacterized protein
MPIKGDARFTADGALDPAFGTDGQVLASPAGVSGYADEEALAVAIQPDGKIAVAGFVDTNEGDFALLWYGSKWAGQCGTKRIVNRLVDDFLPPVRQGSSPFSEQRGHGVYLTEGRQSSNAYPHPARLSWPAADHHPLLLHCGSSTRQGSADPIRASIPLHLAVSGSFEAGQTAALILAGDATELLKQPTRDAIEGLGVPPLRDLFAKARQHDLPIYVWKGSAAIRGATDDDLAELGAEWVGPRRRPPHRERRPPRHHHLNPINGMGLACGTDPTRWHLDR